MPVKALKVVLILNLFILDVLVIYFLLNGRFYPETSLSENVSQQTAFGQFPVDSCGPECKKYIDERTRSLTSTGFPSITLAPTVVAVKTETGINRVSYVPIPGSGSTKESSSWVDLPGTDFYFNLADFPGFLEAYLEANIKLVNGNGEAWVRIFDTTHSVAVSGSEVKTSSQKTSLVVSGKLNFWSGNNVYKIQARSLTADTTVFESGRIKIIYKN